MRIGQAQTILRLTSLFGEMSMSRLLILFLSIGLMACQQQSDTAADAVSVEVLAACRSTLRPQAYTYSIAGV